MRNEQLLLEMPHAMVNTDCPNCGNHIDFMDYQVELWSGVDKPKMLKKLIGMQQMRTLPVICNECDTYFILNKKTGQTEIQDTPDVFLKNKDKIIQENQMKHLNFETYYKALYNG